MKKRVSILGAILICIFHAVPVQGAAPVVSNVRASQRPGTPLVDIYYDMADSDGDRLTISVAVSINAGATYDLPASAFTGDVGASLTPGTNKRIVWNAGSDWNNHFSSNVRFRVTASTGEFQGTRAWWKFDEAGGTVAQDGSPVRLMARHSVKWGDSIAQHSVWPSRQPVLGWNR